MFLWFVLLGLAELGTTTKPHIFQGDAVDPHQYPWVVELNIGGAQCAGALLEVSDDLEESDIVLTAAHCIADCDETITTPCVWKARTPSNVEVTAGTHVQSEKEAGEESSVAVALEIHPAWNHDKGTCSTGGPATSCFSNDLGVIKVAKPFRFGDAIKPIDLPRRDDSVQNFKECVLAGWGYYESNMDEDGYVDPFAAVSSDELRAINVSLLSNEECAKAWNQSEPADSFSNLLCLRRLGENEHGSTSCQGDSGGPLWCTNRQGYPVLLGVVSGGDYVCGGRKPSLCANLTKYLDWIKETKKRLSELSKK